MREFRSVERKCEYFVTRSITMRQQVEVISSSKPRRDACIHVSNEYPRAGGRVVECRGWCRVDGSFIFGAMNDRSNSPAAVAGERDKREIITRKCYSLLDSTSEDCPILLWVIIELVQKGMAVFVAIRFWGFL